VDLRKQTPTSKGVLSAIWDQGQTSACTAYALLGAVEYVTAAVSGTRPWNPIAPSQTFSKRFVYYNTRAIENTTGQDCGAVLADGIKALQKYGACRATKCADAASLILKAPTQEAFTQALSACALSVRSIPNSREKMMECLDHFGLPFVIGIAVFPQFMKVVSLRSSPRRGIVDMPPLPIDWNSCLGGHAILCVGYKFIDNQLYWIVRNSWGTSWGDGGYCYIHGDYFTNSAISTDQWAIEKVGPSQSTRPASGARR
jgi:C1A family cysteine protease